jgi:hypothetical protein
MNKRVRIERKGHACHCDHWPQNTPLVLQESLLSVDDLQEPKEQVARAAHTLNVCKRHLAHEFPSLQ